MLGEDFAQISIGIFSKMAATAVLLVTANFAN